MGVGAWELVRLMGRRREAWDDPIFWQLGYPVMIFAALGPRHGIGVTGLWRWVVAMMGGQAAWSLVLAFAQEWSTEPAAAAD